MPHYITGYPGLLLDEDSRYASADEPVVPLGLTVNELQPGDPWYWKVRRGSAKPARPGLAVAERHGSADCRQPGSQSRLSEQAARAAGARG